jgi:hypothetical protein
MVKGEGVVKCLGEDFFIPKYIFCRKGHGTNRWFVQGGQSNFEPSKRIAT